jgi:hypothetical protein
MEWWWSERVRQLVFPCSADLWVVWNLDAWVKAENVVLALGGGGVDII